MPRVFSIFNVRVMIYPNDHRPAHVHVIGDGNEAVLNLCCPFGPVELRENYGFSTAQLRKISGALMERLDELCLFWANLHGPF